ncbi:ArsR/SmtB family transcription factor [Metabacillus hrfriensis]|uniref:Helix-turn-helix transcriptional regulator n=2 Tax=Metabacillus TaxID=2675233 RepID=A0ACD4RIT5_9BACI|nr:helix-turn-helix transcriptional regulator [Metabacillus sp. CT-WN-B3]UOK56220.1 ArsR family transcriptional regulator [Bacillus sp. OVS6]WHZ60100.1 helix-turn-helix transcriptional regulator [Metabacillus sp. CT-WN-B3]
MAKPREIEAAMRLNPFPLFSFPFWIFYNFLDKINIKQYDSFMTFKQVNLDEKRVKIFKALSEVKRIEIIRYLYHDKNKNNNSCGEIGESIGMNKSNVSYHLKIMVEADLVDVGRDGQYKFIKLKEDTFQAFLPGFLATL